MVDYSVRDNAVFDLGSGIIKAGWAGTDAPRAVFPTIIGSLRYPAAMVGIGAKEKYVGDEAQSQRGMLTITYPIEHGTVTNWDALESVIHHTFYNELRSAPEESPVVMSEHPISPKRDRELLTQMMFETFNIPKYMPAPSPIFSAYASGRTTGVVLDIGDGVMSVTPITEGHILRSTIRRVNFSGRDLTYFMQKLLFHNGYYFNKTADLEFVRDLKEKLCYVALDYEAEVMKSSCSLELRKNYEIPGGQVITLNQERFTCPEALFQPWLVGRESPGVHELVFDAIQSCPIASRKELFGNIILNGGSTMFKGFADRMEKEMTQLAPPNMKCRIIAPPERKYSVWIGGSIFTSAIHLTSRWIHKAEYDELGSTAIYLKTSIL